MTLNDPLPCCRLLPLESAFGGSQEEESWQSSLTRLLPVWFFFFFFFFSQDNSRDLLAPLPGAWRSGPAHRCSWAVSCFRIHIQLVLVGKRDKEGVICSPCTLCPRKSLFVTACILRFPLGCSIHPVGFGWAGREAHANALIFNYFYFFPQ